MSFIEGVINDFRRTHMTRQLVRDQDALSSLAINEGRGYRLPIVFGNDDILLSDRAAWTGFQVPSKPSGFLDNKQIANNWRSATRVFSSIFPSAKENQGQILVTNQVYSPAEWEANLINQATDATSAYAEFIKATRSAIDAREFFEPETYLFVRLGDRGHHDGVRGKLRQWMEYLMLGFGMEENQPDDDEIANWVDQADTVASSLGSSWLATQPINRERVEHLVRHLDTPGLPTPETVSAADGEAWGIGWWRTVLSSYTRQVDLGRVAKNRYKAIEFDSPVGTGKTYAAFLPLSYIPTSMVAPQYDWLHHAASLPFPVDASVRFEIIDPDRALKVVEAPINAAQAQAEEDAEAGVTGDETTAIQQDSLRKVKTQVRMGRQSLARWQAVFCVYDTDKEALRTKITTLIKHYKDIQFDLVNPTFDQRELFYQQFPGGEIEVEDWIHTTEPGYLGAAQPWLTSVAGDRNGTGLYQGFTVVRDSNGRPKRGGPVFYDLLSVVDEEGKAPTEAVAAESGSGKTVSRGVKSAYEDMMRGVTQFIWDPKGDFLSLYVHAHWLRLNREKIKLVNIMDARTSVSLDPFGIAEMDTADPMNIRDDRESSALDVVLALLGRQLQGADANTGEMLIRAAITREMNKERSRGMTPAQCEQARGSLDRPIEEEPCLEGVIQTFEGWADPHSGVPLPPLYSDETGKVRQFAALFGQSLRTHSGSTLGRLLFRRPSQSGAMTVEQGDMILFVAMGLNTTEPGEKQTEKTILGDIISGMMTDYIRSMLYRLPDHYTKCATFDEWHVIKRSERAAALVNWLRRMGRSKRCMVRQMSQSARDFYDEKDAQSSRTSLGTVWCGHVDSDDEAKASCTLLGIEHNALNMGALKALGKGQFLFRDSFGRVAFVQIDFIDDQLLERFDTSAKAKEEALRQLANAS